MRVTLDRADVEAVLQRLAARGEEGLHSRLEEAQARPHRRVSIEVDPREAILLRRALPVPSGAS